MKIPYETIKKAIREQRPDIQVSEVAILFIRSYVQDSIENIVSRVIELQEERNKLRRARSIPMKSRVSLECVKSALGKGNV
jgi:hypothetical protein